jgi:putative ABC transport system permease protein
VSPVEAVGEALRTLRTQKLRSALTMFGVVWGTASVVFLVAWGLGVQRMLEAGYGRVGKNLVQAWAGVIGEQFTPAADRRQLWFTLDDVRTLRRRTHLAEMVLGESRMWRIVVFRERAVSRDVRGIEPAHGALRGTRIQAGRGIGAADVEHRRRVAVLGDDARRRVLGPSGGVGSWVRIGGQPFEVVGLLAPVGTQLWQDGPSRIDEQVWIPLTTLFTFGPRYGTDAEVVDAIALRVRDRHQYAALKREVRSILAERLRISAGDEEAIRMASPLDALDKLPLDQMGGLLLTLGVTTLVIGGIGVLTMMLDAVHERRQEIGVRLAVGARRRDVLVQFFLETFVITAVGGLAGIALGVAGCQVLAGLQVPELIPVPILRADIALLAVAVMSGVGIVAGSVPAWRAARVDPSLTLRAE